MPMSCRRAVITLLPKKGDLCDVKSWRPVSLLASEYKLLSKVLATRLGKVLEEVIHPDQSYCVPGRSIFDNISLIRDLLDVSKMFGLNIAFISIDQEKAFDRVEHAYLWKTLNAFGFSSEFIDKIKVLYNDIESLLKINGGLCAPFKVLRGVRQGCSLSGILYSLAIEPFLHRLRNVLKGVSLPGCNDVFYLSAYADDVLLMIKSQDDVNALVEVSKDFEVVSSARINWSKSDAFFWGEGNNVLPKLPGGLMWKKDGIKYLGIFLGDSSYVQNNWEGIVDKIKGRLDKWRWLKPHMSYRGRILVTNNLVASILWHKLACVDPPVHLLSKVQSLLLDFFWDKLHWVPQSLLYLTKEEGGQGLVHLQSRTAAFRMQFVQKVLTEQKYVRWRPIAFAILRTVGGLGMDRSLFLMDSKRLDISKLPIFYKNLFKVWDLFNVRRLSLKPSLYWLLNEPLIYGKRLDFSFNANAMYDSFIKSRLLTFGQLVGVAGRNFQNCQNVARVLNIRSVRIVRQLLEKCKASLTVEENKVLKGYFERTIFPCDTDQFPNLALIPDFGDNDGIFLDNVEPVPLRRSGGHMFYRLCVKALNQKGLNQKVDTPWRSVLGLGNEVKPEWRALYKPPLVKRVGDLQWRVLHGILAVNAFISVIRPEVSSNCPFCFERETVFHAFMNCPRLIVFFSVLERLFECFNVTFSMKVFIFGFKYVKKHRPVCQLLNFILGQAKMAIYMSRKNKIECGQDQDIAAVFAALVKSRLLIDFHFYKVTENVQLFEDTWCLNGVLCSVENDELTFAHFW